MEYTVIGYYEDSGETWTYRVDATDPAEAVVTASQSCIDRDDPKSNRANAVLVGVFEGHMKDVSDQMTTCSLVDWPGLEMPSSRR